jgi:hypothetical protein
MVTRSGTMAAMTLTPDAIAAALAEALSIKASVVLERALGVPYAVVTGPSGVSTWIDLRPSVDDASPDDGAAARAARHILAAEGWDRLNFDALLTELCVRGGFCPPPADCERLRSAGPFTVDAFTDALIEAEGMNPVTTEGRGWVRQTVARHLGTGPA